MVSAINFSVDYTIYVNETLTTIPDIRHVEKRLLSNKIREFHKILLPQYMHGRIIETMRKKHLHGKL
jgi:hypothetical protein